MPIELDQSVNSPTLNNALTPGSAELNTTTVQQISEALSRRIGAHKYEMWFGHAELCVRDGRLEVATDSQFAAKWIDAHFADDLRSAAADMLGDAVQVDVRVAPRLADADSEKPQPRRASHEATGEGPREFSSMRHGRDSGSHTSQSTDRFTPRSASHARRTPALRRLSDFVVGSSNKLAFAAAVRLAEDPAAGCISPLFLHGECGVGKTHMLQGICHRYIELTGRSGHVRYVTGEQFTNEYIAAIRNNNIDSFRQRVRKLDLLAIDDVHFLANKVRTQTEFLYTLDAIGLGGAKIVLASDNHPHHIKRFSQALVSRFLSGMVVKVDRPDRQMRIALIERLAHARGLRMSQTAVEAVASRCIGSVRELEGAITKLAAFHSLLNGQHAQDQEIGLVLVEQLFREQQTYTPAQAVRIQSVVEAVCTRLAVSKADLLGTGRHRRVVLARALVAYLARELTTQSFPEIAQALGRTNHSTVHTADQRLRRQLENDESVALGNGEASMPLRELTEEIRREILRSNCGNGDR